MPENKLEAFISFLGESPIVSRLNKLGGILTDETVDEIDEIEEHITEIGIDIQ